MDNRTIERLSSTNSFLDLFYMLKRISKKETHVSTLAYFDRIIQGYNKSVGFGIAEVKPFPLEKGQTEYKLNCYFFADVEINQNDMVLVVFSDFEFSGNLNSTASIGTPQVTNSTLNHDLSFGIMLPFNGTGGSLDDYYTKEQIDKMINDINDKLAELDARPIFTANYKAMLDNASTTGKNVLIMTNENGMLDPSLLPTSPVGHITNTDGTLDITKDDNSLNINTKVVQQVTELPKVVDAKPNVIYVLKNDDGIRGYVYNPDVAGYNVIDNFDNNIKKIKVINGNLNENM